MMIKKLGFIFLLIVTSTEAQTFFSKKYTNNILAGNSIVNSHNGGFIITGMNNYLGSLIKIDSIGNIVWSKTRTSSNPIDFITSCSTKDSCIVTLGESVGGIFCMKLKENGDTVWARNIGSGSPSSISQTFDKGFIITGSAASSIVIKLDSLGFLQWRRNISTGNHQNNGITAKQLPDSSYIALLYSEMQLSSIFMSNTNLINFSKTGAVNWTKLYNRSSQIFNWGFDMLITNTGIMVFLNLYDGQYNLGLMKTDFSGNVLWNKKYLGMGSSTPSQQQNIIRLPNGGFAFGLKELHRVDSTGQILGVNLLPLQQVSNLVYKSIVPTKDKGIMIMTNYFEDEETEGIILMKMDSLGGSNSCISAVTGSVATDAFVSTSVLPIISTSGVMGSDICGIFSTSISVNSGCPPLTSIGVREISSADIKLIVAPNPSSGVFNLKMTKVNNSTYSVSDIFGKLITKGNCETETKIDISSEANGIYILQVKDQNGKAFDSRKLIKR